MAITSSEKYFLNHMNSVASKVQLGTLIENAENVVAGEIALAEGSLLVGNASAVAAALDAKTSGQIIVGNGTTAVSVAVSGDITLAANGTVAIASGVIVDADVNASAAIAFSKLAALPDAQLLVGSAGNVATAVAVTGDVTISNAGVTAIASDVIVNADIKSDAAIAFSKLAALPDAQILVGSAGNVATAVAVSGDITISNAGAVAIASGVIVNADINAGAAISTSKLAGALHSRGISDGLKKLAIGVYDFGTASGSFVFVDGDVDTGTDTITEVGHGLVTGDTAVLSTTGAVPTGLAVATAYYVIKLTDDTFQLASSRANALAGTQIDITAAAGGGDHTLTKNVFGQIDLTPTLPDKAIVTRTWYKVATTFTSAGDNATIALQLNSANDITTATAISAGGNIWDAGAPVAGAQDDAIGNFLVLTAQRELIMAVAVENLTAGTIQVFAEYVEGL